MAVMRQIIALITLKRNFKKNWVLEIVFSRYMLTFGHSKLSPSSHSYSCHFKEHGSLMCNLHCIMVLQQQLESC
jgi:hypothetical protein